MRQFPLHCTADTYRAPAFNPCLKLPRELTELPSPATESHATLGMHKDGIFDITSPTIRHASSCQGSMLSHAQIPHFLFAASCSCCFGGVEGWSSVYMCAAAAAADDQGPAPRVTSSKIEQLSRRGGYKV
jgi:hypothetical protein